MSSEYKVIEKGKVISFDNICDNILGLVEKGDHPNKGFDEKIAEKLFRGVVDYGFENPTRIQEMTISDIFKGKDIIAQSQAGTGKTGAFGIGCLSRINPKNRYPQAIIMANTRELAQQINMVCSELGKYMGVKTCLSIGEVVSVSRNISNARHSHIVIGTPGRINDIISKGAFDPHRIKIVVLDEADELLGKNFVDTTREIISSVSKNTQICIFSATLGEDELEMTKHFMTDPLTIVVEQEQLSLENVEQYFVEIPDDRFKISALFDLYGKLTISQAVIFVNSRKNADYVHREMEKDGHVVGVLHRDMSSEERVQVLKAFRKMEIRALIATDIIARGIDIQQIGLVFNYDLPSSPETYQHRIGRSGRYGRLGIAINFMVNEDMNDGNNGNNEYRRRRHPRKGLKDVEKMELFKKTYQVNIFELPNPEILNKKLKGCGSYSED